MTWYVSKVVMQRQGSCVGLLITVSLTSDGGGGCKVAVQYRLKTLFDTDRGCDSLSRTKDLETNRRPATVNVREGFLMRRRLGMTRSDAKRTGSVTRRRQRRAYLSAGQRARLTYLDGERALGTGRR